MAAEQIKLNIKSAVQSFTKGNLTEKSIDLFEKLGYVTQRRAPLHKPSFEEFKDTYIGDKRFDEAKAKTSEWKYVDLLFQLSKEEVQKLTSSFDTKQVDQTVIETYLFFAIELSHDEYSRTELSVITREVNRLFPMPAMILFKHGKTITISAINRRLHKRDDSKDVLEKVTLIKDIVIENPHRAHIEILFDISFDELRNKHRFTNFVELHNAWQKTLDTKELNKRFYSELFNWYLWAVRSVNFPNDIDNDKDHLVYNSENVIRLLTRLIFVWFIKEKNLVPDSLFELNKLKDILKDFKPQSAETSVYYRAVLQNLFFATLNTPMDKDITAENIDEKRQFINPDSKTNKEQYLDQTKYRYQNYFTTPDKALELFSSIPFLNGGLFECLDFKEGNKEIRLDGFSSTEKRQAFIPDKLFFAEKHAVDLNTEYGTKNKKYEVEGLINILESYKFTITENTPLEEEIALDPELLGKVFENLLASYNPETQTTARKQTGSFYTPREIVNYMVDESLIAYFKSIVSIPAHVDNDNILENEFFNPDNEIEIHQGNLPHWQQENVWYFITFRLADSIPTEVVEQIKQERELWLKKHDKNKLTIEQKKEYYKLFSERTENLLNAGKGSCVLKNEKIAKIVSEALLHFNNQRYILDEWVIMPNHVHILLKPFEGYSLPDILHSWKSFTANEINKEIGNKGQLWMHESYDHIVRNEKALQAIRRYIWDNPVKAGITLPSVCLSSNRSKDASFVESRSKDASDTFETKLRDLFTHITDLPEFTKSETDGLIKAISEVKILDPACGSGAFPMGVLHRLVDLLNKLDPENKRWNELQKQRAIAETAEVFESGDVQEREIRLNEINKAFDLSMNYPDYARKLFLIENCIYGVDIQQIAIQISKLRFFISLIVDQKVDDSKPNRNMLSMPNLETKFVAANTLIGLDKPQQLTLMAGDVEKLEKELGGIRRKIFFTRKYSDKKILKEKEKAKREELQTALTQSGFSKNVAAQMAGWNPFDPMQSAKFFDPETMFGIVPPTSMLEGSKQGGFDVVIGNPPYGIVFDIKIKEVYELRYPTFKRNNDIYVAFFESSFSLLSKIGTLNFITPNTFLNGDYFKSLRKYFREKALIHHIVDFKNSKIFQDPTVFVCISIIQKTKQIKLPYVSLIKISNEDFTETEQKYFSIIEVNDAPFKPANSIIDKILNKHKNNYYLVDEKFFVKDVGFNYWSIGKGKKRDGDSIGDRILYSGDKKNNKDKPFLKGKNIEKYFFSEPNNYLRHNFEDYLESGVDIFRYSVNFLEVTPKIIYRQTSNKIVATLDFNKNLCDKTVHVIIPKSESESVAYLVSLLNSQLFDYFYKDISQELDGRTFAQVKTTYIKQLPVIKANETQQQPFINLVDQILSAKAANPNADTSHLEKQIDELVYKLYELTNEEIAIIEGNK